MRQALAALALSALASAALRAQTITGTVLDSASRQPIPGAVVQLLGPGGEARGRTLSDARGAFVVRASGSATTLRVVRIGFLPRVLTLPVTAAEANPRALGEVRMRRIPAFLDAVRVVAAQCRARRNRGRSPIGLVEQARAGLLTSVVTRERNPAAMTRVTFERVFAAGPQFPTQQRLRLDSATQQTRSFRAVRDAASFVNNGFAQRVDGEQYFFAPDADVLLDDRFAAGYCFRVMPGDRARPREIGLGFEPATRKDGRVDVEGALWIDTVARELRQLEFRYVGLERPAEVVEPGGSISFQTLENGLVVVDRWEMHLVGALPDTLAPGRDGTPRIATKPIAVHSGGELVGATWSDGTQWQSPLGVLTGTARWRGGGPAAGATLALADTPFRSRVDSAGRFVFRDLLPGRYDLFVDDSAVISIGLDIPTSYRVTTDRDSVAMSLTLPTRTDIAGRYCPPSGPFDPASRTLFLGRAIRRDGQPIEGAVWEVRTDTGAGWDILATDLRTEADGLMPYCTGLLREAELEVVVRTPEGLVHTQRRRLDDAATIVPFRFPPPP